MILTFVVAWLWMNEFTFLERKKIEAIAYGQTIALFLLKYTLMASAYELYPSFENQEMLFDFLWVESLTILTFIYVLWIIVKESKDKHNIKTVLLLIGAVTLLGFLSFKVGGLTLGIMFLLIGFAHSHRLLMGLGIVSSLAFLSHYYYFLGETLMVKAEVLAIVGMTLLLSRLIMKLLLKKEVLDV
jgi:uncharacterized membrane protein